MRWMWWIMRRRLLLRILLLVGRVRLRLDCGLGCDVDMSFGFVNCLLSLTST